MRGPECSLKVEVSMQEPLLADPIQRPLIHEFPRESLQTTMATCRLEEIAAEKLRVFLQSRRHPRDRGWLKNRPRDLYDLWHLQRQSDVPIYWQEVARLPPDEVQAYGLFYGGPEDFLDEQVLAGIQRHWRGQLANFVADLLTFEQCIPAFCALLSETFGYQSLPRERVSWFRVVGLSPPCLLHSNGVGGSIVKSQCNCS